MTFPPQGGKVQAWQVFHGRRTPKRSVGCGKPAIPVVSDTKDAINPFSGLFGK